MGVKQIKWRAAAFAVTVIAVLTALFALTTETSNATDVIKEQDEHGNWTYTMSDSTYDQQIYLENDTTTTIKLIGDNKVTYWNPSDPGSTWCINGGGNLKIIGSGTLETPNGGICCNNLTISDGAKLKGRYAPDVFGSVNIDNADIEAAELIFNCGDEVIDEINISNTRIKTKEGLYLGGNATLTNCNVTIEKGSLTSEFGELTIDGGKFNINQDPNTAAASVIDVEIGAIISNAAIKTNSYCSIPDMEMTNSTLEIDAPSLSEGTDYSRPPIALYGDNLIFAGSKIKIYGSAPEGIYATQQLVMTDNTEIDIKGLEIGIMSKTVDITRSKGTIQVTDPSRALAAVMGVDSQSGSTRPGTIKFNSVYVIEPAGGTVGETVFKPVGAPESSAAQATAIMNGDAPAKKVILDTVHNPHTWDAGKVTKKPTETAEGVKTYTCIVCGETKTEAIPKLTPAPAYGADGTPAGAGASEACVDKAITSCTSEEGPKGTKFAPLTLKSNKQAKNSITLNWTKAKGAKKYVIYGSKCGKGIKMQKLATATGSSKVMKKVAGKKIKKGTYYKFIMVALDKNNKVVSTSKVIHIATKGGKVTNPKKVTVKKKKKAVSKITVKKGKTVTVKSKVTKASKKLKLKIHRKVKYESTNKKIATVTSKGRIKGVKKGTCYIYAYAQNGVAKKLKVTVK